MNTQTITEAAEAWATRWADDMLAANVGPTLTCEEADAVAGLLRATGRTAEAEDFLNQHGANDEQLDAHYPRTVVYSKPGCPQCTATERAMTAAGIEHETVDVSTDDDARAYVQALGYAQAPVVVAAGGADHWSGFQPDRIAGLADTV